MAGKADGAGAVLLGQFQAFAITARQLLRLAMSAVAVNWADGVKNVACGKRAGPSDYSAAAGTSARACANSIELPHDRGAARAMDGAIHATSAVRDPNWPR